MTSTEDKIAVMQAYVEGKKIQSRCCFPKEIDNWEDCCDPVWNWGQFDYRIKPEPRRFWIRRWGDNSMSAYESEKGARNGLTEIKRSKEEIFEVEEIVE